MSVERLAELFRERGPAVVLTGAGISTESGIPDFRSPDGHLGAVDPLEYGSLDAFRRDPAKVWDFYAPRFSMLGVGRAERRARGARRARARRSRDAPS